MRIDAKDRRLLNRRLYNRMAPAWRAGLVKTPIVVLITVSIWLTPDAIAKVQDNSATIAAQAAGHEVVGEKTVAADPYSKEGLQNSKLPPPLRNFGDRISEQIIAIINTMGENAADLQGRSLSSTTDADYVAAQSAMTANKNPQRSELDPVRTKLKDETGNAAGKNFVESSRVWEKFKAGFDFKLDLAKIFSASEPAAPTGGGVRYGLILKDVVPEQDKSHQSAAVGATREDELQLAGGADVVWTIGPVEETAGASVFSESEMATAAPEPTGIPLYDNGIPSPSLQTHVAPDGDNAKISKIRENGRPIMKITLQQEQGLYQMDMKTTAKGQKGFVDKESAEHKVNVPVFENLSFGRRYGDKFDVVETSANGILVSKKAPLLSVRYAHESKVYSSELGFGAGPTSINLKAAQKPFKDVDKDSKFEDYQYQVGFKHDF